MHSKAVYFIPTSWWEKKEKVNITQFSVATDFSSTVNSHIYGLDIIELLISLKQIFFLQVGFSVSHL